VFAPLLGILGQLPRTGLAIVSGVSPSGERTKTELESALDDLVLTSTTTTSEALSRPCSRLHPAPRTGPTGWTPSPKSWKSASGLCARLTSRRSIKLPDNTSKHSAHTCQKMTVP
jgi:hypothetical protein